MKWIIPVLVLCLSTSAAFAGKKDKKKKKKSPRISSLQVLESHTVPSVEISGMAWRTDPTTKKRELVLVGDRDSKILVIDWENRKTGLLPRETVLKPLPSASPSAEDSSAQSQWESVFSDDSGRLFIIQEDPAQILVVAPDLGRIESRIRLTVPKDSPLAPSWNQEGNGKGEGLLPLKNGHILVVKERGPIEVIEFAPAGAAAEGYRKELSLEKNGRFPLPKDALTEFYPVHRWKLTSESEELFEDASGLDLDRQGNLYLLGDQQNLVGKIGKTLKADESEVRVERLWSIPSVLRQPEGMVIDDGDRPIIAIDRKNAKKANLFLLSPMN
jgi:uncharacterized protein YjiK